MKKGFYYFGESGRLSKILVFMGFVSLIIAIVFFFAGGDIELTRPNAIGNTTYAIWSAFFFLFGIVAFIVNYCIHKICIDIATALKKIEDKHNK